MEIGRVPASMNHKLKNKLKFKAINQQFKLNHREKNYPLYSSFYS